MLLDTKIGHNDELSLSVSIMWDHRAGMHRVMVVDMATHNDASRGVTNGRDKDGAVPVQSFVDVLPEMIEEIIVLNKLMGPK